MSPLSSSIIPSSPRSARETRACEARRKLAHQTPHSPHQTAPQRNPTSIRPLNLGRHQSRLLIAKVLNIPQNLLSVLTPGRRLEIGQALEVQRRLDGVGRAVGELEHAVARHAGVFPLAEHHGHVGGEVVVHVELDALGVEDCDLGFLGHGWDGGLVGWWIEGVFELDCK